MAIGNIQLPDELCVSTVDKLFAELPTHHDDATSSRAISLLCTNDEMVNSMNDGVLDMF